MPRAAAGAIWEQRFRSSIRTAPGLAGFTVSNTNNRGRFGVRWQPTDGRKPQSVVLDLAWSQENTGKALLLLNRAVKAMPKARPTASTLHWP